MVAFVLRLMFILIFFVERVLFSILRIGARSFRAMVDAADGRF